LNLVTVLTGRPDRRLLDGSPSRAIEIEFMAVENTR
jgi:hypothetical protein